MGGSCFRLIMCVTKSDLTHNLSFHDTDNILGTGDTPVLVLPSLEVKASCCADDGRCQALPCLQSPEPRLLTTSFGARDLHIGPSRGPWGLRNTHPCGQLITDSVWCDSSTYPLWTEHRLPSDPWLFRCVETQEQGPPKFDTFGSFCFSQCNNKMLVSLLIH